MEKNRKKAFLFAAVAIFFWATIPSAFKLGLQDTSPATFLFWANATSLALFLAIILFTGKSNLLLQQSRRELLFSALLGILSPFGYYLILFEAYSRLPGQVAQPLNMIWPLVLVFLSAVILKQKISARSYAALLISFAGIFFVSSQGDLLGFRHTDITGVVLAAGSYPATPPPKISCALAAFTMTSTRISVISPCNKRMAPFPIWTVFCGMGFPSLKRDVMW